MVLQNRSVSLSDLMRMNPAHKLRTKNIEKQVPIGTYTKKIHLDQGDPNNLDQLPNEPTAPTDITNSDNTTSNTLNSDENTSSPMKVKKITIIGVKPMKMKNLTINPKRSIP